MPEGIRRKAGPLRVAVLYPAPYLDSVPAVRNLIVMLAESGAEVDVFVLESGQRHNAVRFGGQTRVFEFPSKTNRSRLLRAIPTLPQFIAWVFKHGRGRAYDFVVGVDPAGLAAAYALTLILRAKLVYYSLEIIASYDSKRMYKGYKWIELRASRAASFIFIQDEGRAQVMADDNALPLAKFRYLPNSPLVSEAEASSNTYFHEKFGLAAGTRVALYAGSISTEFWSRELADAADSLPEGWVLVFHSRHRRSLEELESFFGRKLNRDRVYISGDPVEAADVAKVFASCNLGFAFYADTDSPNIRYIGKSAGKVTSLLMQSKPVVMTSLPGWDDWLPQYHSGRAVRSPAEIPGAVAAIVGDLPAYAAGARLHFEAELRFEPACKVIVEELEALCCT